jgi:putative CocE/NonD family hydrolase
LSAPRVDTEVQVDRDVVIRMRDGTALVADVYRPADADGELSTVLVRTSYDKRDILSNVDPMLFARHGFAVVIQDVRGRWGSEGTFYHGIHETEDGEDTLAWIAAQPWSNGRVGMSGISYLAAVQCAAALSGSAHLRSMFHVKAPMDYYRNGNRHGGNAAMYMAPITFFFASTSREAQADPLLQRALLAAFGQGKAWLKRVPLKRGLSPLAAAPGIESWLLDIMSRSEYGEFWRRVRLWQPGEYLDEYADIPGLYVSGWYDMYREPDFVEALLPRKRGPIRLLMGPWTHLDFARSSGDVDFGPAAALTPEEYYALQLAWFDETLRDAPPSQYPPVRIFVMGGGDGRKTADGKLGHGGTWRYEQEWPPARAEAVEAYFQPGSALAFARPPADAEPTAYLHDPARPVPTIGGVNYFLEPDPDTGLRRTFVPHGGQDQRERVGVFACDSDLPLSSRHDVVVFETEPLSEDVEVTGTPVANLWFASSAVDTDFVVKLVDVYPPNEDYLDGYALNVSEGIMRARYRDSYESPELLVPGETAFVSVRLHPTSNLFKTGHRIRIQLASSDYPGYDVNPGTGGTIFAPKGPPVVAENAIFHDAERPSHIVLPLVRQRA